jgi:hypothetical protein
MLEGLPKSRSKNGNIAFIASGASGVVAL